MKYTNPSRLLTPSLLFAFLAITPLSAQETLRYRSSDQGTITIDSPQGVMDVQADYYAEVTFEMGDGATMVAHYDSLVVYVGGPQGDQSPDVAGLLAGEFTLEFERPGVVVTRAHPEVDVGSAAGFDPLHVFDDFFIPLPEEDLAVGLEWSESFVHEGSSQPDGSYYSERTMSLKVERDTTVAGMDAYVVSVSQTVMLETSGIVADQGFDFVSVLSGEETGTAILSAAGLLLYRSRESEMAGMFTISAQGQTFDMFQAVSFVGTIERISH